MKYKIPGTSDLYISDNEEISGVGFDCNQPTKSNKVLISMYNTKRYVDKHWLFLISKLKLDYPEMIDTIKFVPKIVGRRSFPYRVCASIPRWFDQVNQIRYVPDYPAVAVSKFGDCFDVVNKAPCRISYVSGYKYADIYDTVTNKRIMVAVHRLVALAWIQSNVSGFYDVVNHKDGVKTNNYVGNLEWTTYKSNNIHAVNNKLRNTISCYLRNIDTGEILEFPSISQMKRFLGSRAKDIYALAKYKNRIYNNKYEMRLEGDTFPWIYTSKDVNRLASRYIFIINKDTKNECVVNGTLALIEKYNLSVSKGSNVKEIKIAFHNQYQEDSLDIIDQNISKPIDVRNVLNGEIITFKTQREVAEFLNVTKDKIKRELVSNKNSIINQYQIRYKSNKPWSNTIKVNKFKPMKIKVIDTKTNNVCIYPSLRSVAAALGVDRKLVKRSIDHSLKNDLYKFELID